MGSRCPALRHRDRDADSTGMTTALPRTPGRHRAPAPTAEPRWATPAEFLAAWGRVGRHAARKQSGRSAGAQRPADGTVFDWLGFAPAAG